MNKCNICRRKTTGILTCHECDKLTLSFYNWMNSFKKDRKNMTETEIVLAVSRMQNRINRSINKILKEWGFGG